MVAKERSFLDEGLVEKDYWIMHCLWGIQQQGYRFELKGGTSLSKAFGIIERFSEDIDIQIHPSDINVKTGKNHDKLSHIDSRRIFFDRTANELKIPDLVFLELGFDKTNPNMPCDITSWAFEKAIELKLPVIDNRAKQVSCYYPEYTFTEKLQTISTKYRKQQNENTMPINFLRHYYDVYKLLENDRVLKFIGSEEYITHKNARFRTQDEKEIRKNLAFTIPDTEVRKLYGDEFKKKSKIYYGKQPEFEDILARISNHIGRL